jgi:hypothetical protein
MKQFFGWMMISSLLLGRGIQADKPIISQQEEDYVRNNLKAESLQAQQLKVPAEELKMRQGLPHFFKRSNKEKSLTVAYFGGSITNHSQGYREQSFEALQKMVGSCQLKMINAGLGGTGSIVGVFRADEELIKFKPDLVIVEFAVNDGGDAIKRTKDVVRSLEGIYLKVKASNPEADIVFFYTMQTMNIDTVRQGYCHPAVAVHEQVASYYGIPSVYVGPSAVKAVDEGRAVFFGKVADKSKGTDASGKLVITDDNTHPVRPTGHAFYAEVLSRSLEKLKDQPLSNQVAKMPKPIYGKSWEKAKTIVADGNAKFDGNWEKLTKDNGPIGFRFGAKVYEKFPYLYRTATPGDSVTVRFKGSVVGIKGMKGPDSGNVEISVDGHGIADDLQFTVYNNRYFYEGAPINELDDGEHTVKWTLSSKHPDKAKILASYYKPGQDEDLKSNPENYAIDRLSVGEIILIGDIVIP